MGWLRGLLTISLTAVVLIHSSAADDPPHGAANPVLTPRESVTAMLSEYAATIRRTSRALVTTLYEMRAAGKTNSGSPSVTGTSTRLYIVCGLMAVVFIAGIAITAVLSTRILTKEISNMHVVVHTIWDRRDDFEIITKTKAKRRLGNSAVPFITQGDYIVPIKPELALKKAEARGRGKGGASTEAGLMTPAEESKKAKTG